MRGERGQIIPLIAGVALVALAVTGLAVDGTRAFVYRRTLQSAADSAALVAAAHLDRTAYYRTGGDAVRLGRRVEAVASRWLARRGLAARPQLHAGRTEVTVVLRGTVRTPLLSLVGIDGVPVAVEAVARPMPGVEGP